MNIVGDHDFSATLNQAIERAAAPAYKSHPKWPLTTDRIFIPSGIYHAHSTIKLRSGVEIAAESQASVAIVSHLDGDQPLFESDPADEIYAVKIKNLHAVAARKFNGRFLKVHNANRNCSFEELFVEQFLRGVEFHDSFTTVFRDINVYMCRQGVLASNMTNGRWSAVKVENCADHGVILTNQERRTTTGLLIDGLVVQGNGRAGLYIDGIDQARIVSLFAEGNNRKQTRVSGDEEDFAQVVLTADRSLLNRRNGNIMFESTFVTPGHSDMSKTVAIKIDAAENVKFDGGLIRTFKEKFETAFGISDQVNVCEVSNMTFERFAPDKVFRVTPATKFTARNNVTSSAPGAPYHRLDDVA